MKIIQTSIPDVLLLEPEIFSDERGFFFESYNERKFSKETGIIAKFVQDNHSCSVKNVLRGLHYQIQQPQGKLMRVVVGEVFDVAVDIRRSSRTFGQWAAFILSDRDSRMAWIPEGFAHGFLVLSTSAEFIYKATDYYAPEFERSIVWNDPQLDIAWPLSGVAPVLSEKDKAGQRLADAEVYS